MSNWKKKTLKEVVKLWVRGSTPRRNNKDYYCGKEGIPFVRAGDLRGGELKETELYLTWEGAERKGAKGCFAFVCVRDHWKDCNRWKRSQSKSSSTGYGV